MSVSIEQIEQLNKRAQFLNNERQKMLGKKESARQSYDKAVFAYKQKYGVELDDTNLQEEYNKVNAKTQEDFEKLNKLVLSIESGEYKTANDVTIPELPKDIQQVNVAPQPTVQQASQQQAPPTTFVDPSLIQNQQPVQQPQFVNPTPQQQPVVPNQPVQPMSKEEDVSEQAFTPAGWGQPNKSLNDNFASIMDGGVKFGQ